MKEGPILMNGAMVRAVLDDRKTHTRRIVKMKQSDWCKEIKGDCWHPNDIAEWRLQGGRWFGLMGWYTLAFADCPFGTIGDRLWVRENWAFHKMAIGSVQDEDGPFVYAADGCAELSRLSDKWTPSIHMPRWASRILLEITNIRIERLKDISHDDAITEGLRGITKDGTLVKYGIPDRDGYPGTDNTGWPWEEWRVSPVDAYRKLWESINGPGSWDVNPWVWVIEFKVLP